MFSNILVPTDGSDLAIKAAREAVKIAHVTGARVTAFHVIKPYTLPLERDDAASPPASRSREHYAAETTREANRYLDAVKAIAATAGVECVGHYVSNDAPAAAIVRAAHEYRCDSIVMGSHGRSGIRKLLLGSETQKVLASTDTSVLVVR
jgi:nucleotide-binding universal stress UspA family protein